MVTKYILIIISLVVGLLLGKLIYEKPTFIVVKEINRYHVCDNEYNLKQRKAAIKRMKEILYGYPYEPYIPKEYHPWHRQDTSRHQFNIFPGGDLSIKIR